MHAPHEGRWSHTPTSHTRTYTHKHTHSLFHIHTHAQTLILSILFSAHLRARTHVLPQRHLLSHIRMGPHTSQTHSHTSIHTPSTRTSSHSLFNSHIHTSTHPNIHRHPYAYNPHSSSYIPTLFTFTLNTLLIFTLLTSSYTCCYTHAHHTYPPACTHSHTHSPSPPHSLTHASPALAHAQSHTVLQPSTQAWACASAAVRTLCPAWMPMCLESGDYC